MNFIKPAFIYAAGNDTTGGQTPDPNAGSPEKLLDNQEMMQRFKISYRTLQNWIDKKIVNRFFIGGKSYYLESEVEEMIRKKAGKQQ
ncbi:MAG: helix-turn-helix domain-containing protein [Sphingobacteriales bacterium]|nr:helix-turn-helix domain-containing protein [Sphingobacteriales bacterium]